MTDNRNDTRYRLTDTGLRENEIARTKLEKDIAVFLKGGGKIQQVPIGATALNPLGTVAFVINRNHKPLPTTKAARQKWKEGDAIEE